MKRVDNHDKKHKRERHEENFLLQILKGELHNNKNERNENENNVNNINDTIKNNSNIDQVKVSNHVKNKDIVNNNEAGEENIMMNNIEKTTMKVCTTMT